MKPNRALRRSPPRRRRRCRPRSGRAPHCEVPERDPHHHPHDESHAQRLPCFLRGRERRLDLPGPDVLVTRDCARPAAGAPSSPSVVAAVAGCEPDRSGGGAGAGSGAVGSGRSVRERPARARSAPERSARARLAQPPARAAAAAAPPGAASRPRSEAEAVVAAAHPVPSALPPGRPCGARALAATERLLGERRGGGDHSGGRRFRLADGARRERRHGSAVLAQDQPATAHVGLLALLPLHEHGSGDEDRRVRARRHADEQREGEVLERLAAE